MTSTVALGLIAVTAVIAAAAVTGSLRIRRANRELHEALRQGLLATSERLDSLAKELEEAVATVREEGSRARVLASLDGMLTLDEVLARGAEAASSLQGVAAAAITVELNGHPLVAAVGVDPGTIEATAGPPGDAAVRAVGLSYHYRDGSTTAAQMLSAVAVPIETENGRMGFLTVYGRTEEPPVAGAAFRTLEAIAEHVGPAAERAAATSSRENPATDMLTGLATREELHESLALAVASAHRRGAKLSVCVLDLDDLGAASARLGHGATDAVIGELGALLRESVRPGDLVFRSGGDEFVVVLPDSGRIEAEATFARVQGALRRLPHAPGFTRSVSAGIAELKPDDDGVSLFARAKRAMRRAKDAGKGTAA